MSDVELIIAKEAQLMYRRAQEFTPVSGNLRLWRGSIPGRGRHAKKMFEVEIALADDFPRSAPSVKMITPTDHPQINRQTGEVSLKILSDWRPEYHVHQVVNTLKGLFARKPPKPIYVSAPSPAVTGPRPTVAVSEGVRRLQSKVLNLERETTRLREALQSKDEELARIHGAMDARSISLTGQHEAIKPSGPKEEIILDLEGEKIATEDLLQNLEEKYESGEISDVEYGKLYKRYKKELYLVRKKLEELKK
ncbi:MAG: ubiquitin-conjugating enzyme E2 [Candidatus Hodarchaeota archaeon]